MKVIEIHLIRLYFPKPLILMFKCGAVGFLTKKHRIQKSADNFKKCFDISLKILKNPELIFYYDKFHLDNISCCLSKESSCLRDSLVLWISKSPYLRIYQGNWRLISQQNFLGKFALLPLWPKVIRRFKMGKRLLWSKICQILSFSLHALFIGSSNVTFRA